MIDFIFTAADDKDRQESAWKDELTTALSWAKALAGRGARARRGQCRAGGAEGRVRRASAYEIEGAG